MKLAAGSRIDVAPAPKWPPCPGDTAESLGLTGEESFSITGLEGLDRTPEQVTVTVASSAGERSFEAKVRIDTPAEAAYFQHGGILQYVLRQLLAA